MRQTKWFGVFKGAYCKNGDLSLIPGTHEEEN